MKKFTLCRFKFQMIRCSCGRQSYKENFLNSFAREISKGCDELGKLKKVNLKMYPGECIVDEDEEGNFENERKKTIFD